MSTQTVSKSYERTRKLVECALLIAVGTVLSIFSFQGFWAAGGSVTICATLPLVIISYRYGLKWGLFSAFVYSVIQLILGLHNIRALSIDVFIAAMLLDYIIAFTVIGLGGIFRNKIKNQDIALVCGVVFTYSLRLLSHFISGIFVWEQLFPNELGMISPVYSIVYNGSFMLPEILISAVAVVIISRIINFKKKTI